MCRQNFFRELAQQDMFAGHLHNFLQMRLHTGYFEALRLVSLDDIQLTNRGMVSDAVTVNEDTSQ
jgi:hypothetical protein